MGELDELNVADDAVNAPETLILAGGPAKS